MFGDILLLKIDCFCFGIIVESNVWITCHIFQPAGQKILILSLRYFRFSGQSGGLLISSGWASNKVSMEVLWSVV